MDKYYVNRNAQPGGEHEVHKEGCVFMPKNPIFLGLFDNCWDALERAKDFFDDVDGGKFCCEECHTK